MTKLLVIGLDGATWSVIKPNLAHLPYFKNLISQGEAKSLIQKESLLSAAIWTTIFSGQTLKEHGHEKFVVNNQLQTRQDVKVRFVWDILHPDYDIRALQIPFIMPPYNFNCYYQPVEYGASSEPADLEKDTHRITLKSLEILKENPDVFIVVYSALDKIQHFHWGEPLVLAWYKKMDRILAQLTPFGQKIIILSDHGFCDRGQAKVQTLPEKNSRGQLLKGDHHQEAICLTKNVSYSIREPKDVFQAILEEVKRQNYEPK